MLKTQGINNCFLKNIANPIVMSMKSKKEAEVFMNSKET